MKNIIKIDKQRLDFSLRYDLGDIPTDKEILDYILSDGNEFIEEDSFKLINKLAIKQGYLYSRDKITTEWGEEYPQEWLKRILNEFSEYMLKVIKEYNRWYQIKEKKLTKKH